MRSDDLPPPQSYDYRNVACIEMLRRQKEDYFDALDWTPEEFVDPGLAVAILHDAGLDDVKMCACLTVMFLPSFSPVLAHLKILLLCQAFYCVLGITVCPEARM